MKKVLSYFTKTELIIWICSISFILASFLVFDRESYHTLVASLLGATALIFCAKGNPIGMIIMVVFCIFYGYIAWTFRYYGELMTYVFMSLPMSVFSLVSWLKNPYKGKVSEVAIRKLTSKDVVCMLLSTVGVTVIFYFILAFFGTANLIPSTFSVSTSFFAVFLMSKRSPYFALAYAANDIVLIVLWVLASFSDRSYISVVICFITFLVNDIYSFVNWMRMQKKQNENR